MLKEILMQPPWKKWSRWTVMCVLSGTLDYLAGPGVGINFVAPVMFVPLFKLIDESRSYWAALGAGGATCFWSFALALWSLPIALANHSGISLISGLLIYLAETAIEAIPMAVGCLLWFTTKRRFPSLPVFVVAPICLGLSYYLIATPLAYSHAAVLLDTRFVFLVNKLGRELSSTLVFTINGLIFALLQTKRVWIGGAAMVFSGLAMIAPTFLPERIATHGSMNVMIVDPNSPPSYKRSRPHDVLLAHTRLTQNALRRGRKVDLVVWGEAVLSQPRQARQHISLVHAVDKSTPILFGAVVIPERGARPQSTNSALVTSNCSPMCRYDKHKLVPLTESTLPGVFGRLARNAQFGSDTLAGNSSSVVRIGDQRLGVLICFEGMFKSEVARASHAGAEALINIVSDDWLIDPVMRRYHEGLARLAALEFGLPLLRLSNRGRTVLQASDGTILMHFDHAAEKELLELVAMPLRRRSEGLGYLRSTRSDRRSSPAP